LCLNYVQGGACLIDGRSCLLGARGNEARNNDRECPRHGPFDVWKTGEDLILISDLGGPYQGVKDCYGLGISLQEASRAAQNQALRLATRIVTTQRKCGKCGVRFWPRADLAEGSALDRAADYFCASCLKLASEADLEECWRQIGGAEGRPKIDLSEWCG
jgi:hypothetical protein